MRELIEPIGEGLEWTIAAAAMALAAALLVLLVDMTAGKRLAPSFRCWLWMLVAFRLMMPIAPESPLSAQHA